MTVTVGFVIFRADTLSYALSFIAKMFSGFDFSVEKMSIVIHPLSPFFIIMFIVAIICCGPLQKLSVKVSNLQNSTKALTKTESTLQALTFLCVFIIFVWCIIRLAGGTYNPFIYFRF